MKRDSAKPKVGKRRLPGTEDEMRPEYDLSKLTGKVRGKYYGRCDPSVFVLVADRPSREGRGKKK